MSHARFRFWRTRGLSLPRLWLVQDYSTPWRTIERQLEWLAEHWGDPPPEKLDAGKWYVLLGGR